MKTLHTSHFGRKHADRPQVQIASYAPKSWHPPGYLTEPALVWRHFTNRKKFKGDWKADYRAQLEEMLAEGSLEAILDRLPEGAVLLCWERDPDGCHRQVLAQFLNSHRLARVTEL